VKSRGGLTIGMFEDFAFYDGYSYSLKHLKTFRKEDPLKPGVSIG
jgi:hypothetical protein